MRFFGAVLVNQSGGAIEMARLFLRLTKTADDTPSETFEPAPLAPIRASDLARPVELDIGAGLASST